MSSHQEMQWSYENYDENYVSAHLPEGDYTVKIIQVTPTAVKSGPNEGVPGLILAMEVIEGQYAGQHVVERLYNLSQTAWRHAAFNKAIGLKVAKGQKLNVSNQFYVGKTLSVTLKDGEPYKGNIKSEISAFKPAAKKESAEPSGSVTPAGASFVPDESVIDSYQTGGGATAEQMKDITTTNEDPWAGGAPQSNGSVPAGVGIQL